MSNTKQTDLKDIKSNELVKRGRQRSFGRTSSRMSLADQEKLDTRLAEFELKYTNTKDEQIDLPKILSKYNKLVVELGIGNGQSVYNRSGDEPENAFIGVEVYKNGLRSLVIDMEKSPHKNLKISGDDARNVLEALPENSVDELVVLYPDPWPKKRHNKKRIIQKDFLELAAKVVKEDGKLFIATDIPDYAFWMIREIMQQGDFFPTAIDPIEWTKAPNWWVSTKYEKKALQLGRRPWYMTFAMNVEKINTKCETL
jgi:tRNA (guanine-N7-)-methyltransferase